MDMPLHVKKPTARLASNMWLRNVNNYSNNIAIKEGHMLSQPLEQLSVSILSEFKVLLTFPPFPLEIHMTPFSVIDLFVAGLQLCFS